MRLASPPDTQLTYCLNVHPGANLAEVEAALFTHAPDVFAALPGASAPFGLGAWFGAEVVRRLEPLALRDRLARQGMYIFTLNGFPFGRFHGTRVKEAVYRPDWGDPERLAYTERLAESLAVLLPEGVCGSISSLPLGYRSSLTPCKVAAAVRALRQVATGLDALEERTGRSIRLGLEPEPDCWLDTTATTVRFFQEALWAGVGADERERLARRIGVCLDTVHAGVLFESPQDQLTLFAAAGIAVVKCQLGAALVGQGGVGLEAALAPFAEPVYLHQVCIRRDTELLRFADLPEALARADLLADPAAEWRIHFHVPLTWGGTEHLTSTSREVTPALLQAACATGCKHLEVEVYTLDVFPGRQDERAQILAAELAEVQRRLR